jgi:hypothetical protein
MRHPLLCAVSFLAASGLLSADQAKNAPPTTTRVAPPPAVQPTPRPKADPTLFIGTVTGYVGANAVITPRVTFSGGPAGNLDWVVPNCRFEVVFPSLPTRTYEKPCNAPFSIDVPDDRHYDSTEVSARVLAGADMNASRWAAAKVSFRSGPTFLEIRHGEGRLPANLAPAAGITEAEDVVVTLYKMFPDGTNKTPLPNRSLLVTVTGGQATAVPKADPQGNVSFQVLHVKSVTPAVDVLFQGDTAYASSHASATLTPGPQAKQHH